MNYRLTIAGKEYSKCIKSIDCNAITPNDSNARSNGIDNIIIISGIIGTEESNIDFYKWALLSPGKNDIYRDISFEIVANNNQVIRKASFPNAFVVNYSESFPQGDGSGQFRLALKQKMDKNEGIIVSDT